MRERENDKGGRRVAEDEVGPLLVQLQAGADFGPMENGDILLSCYCCYRITKVKVWRQKGKKKMGSKTNTALSIISEMFFLIGHGKDFKLYLT